MCVFCERDLVLFVSSAGSARVVVQTPRVLAKAAVCDDDVSMCALVCERMFLFCGS